MNRIFKSDEIAIDLDFVVLIELKGYKDKAAEPYYEVCYTFEKSTLIVSKDIGKQLMEAWSDYHKAQCASN